MLQSTFWQKSEKTKYTKIWRGYVALKNGNCYIQFRKCFEIIH